MIKHAWRVSEVDDAAVVLEDVAVGEQVNCGGVLLTATADIPQGHKIAFRTIPAGKLVKKYGVAIGEAMSDIHPGDHIHTHNLRDITERLCKEYDQKYSEEDLPDG